MAEGLLTVVPLWFKIISFMLFSYRIELFKVFQVSFELFKHSVNFLWK